MKNTLIGHGFVKPFGYPGDYSLIHNIYKEYVNPDSKYSNWDPVFSRTRLVPRLSETERIISCSRCAEIDKADEGEKRVLILHSGPPRMCMSI